MSYAGSFEKIKLNNFKLFSLAYFRDPVIKKNSGHVTMHTPKKKSCSSSGLNSIPSNQARTLERIIFASTWTAEVHILILHPLIRYQSLRLKVPSAQIFSFQISPDFEVPEDGEVTSTSEMNWNMRVIHQIKVLFFLCLDEQARTFVCPATRALRALDWR